MTTEHKTKLKLLNELVHKNYQTLDALMDIMEEESDLSEDESFKEVMEDELATLEEVAEHIGEADAALRKLLE